LLRIQRKVFAANMALAYFMLNEWKFDNKKLLALVDNLSADNKKEFGSSYEIVDATDYFKWVYHLFT